MYHFTSLRDQYKVWNKTRWVPILMLFSSFLPFFCFAQNITLTTQAEVDAFAETVVNGDLIINSSGSADPIINLDGLSGLVELNGDLRIEDNEFLTDINGLSGLTDIVGDNAIIYNNSALENIDGLNNLTHITGFLSIFVNPALTNINGLNNLTNIIGGLAIFYNTALTNIDGLSNLTDISGKLIIESNATLTSINGLTNLTEVSGSLVIGGLNSGNNSLTNIDGLSNLKDISGELTIQDNAALNNIDGLLNLTDIDGSLIIRHNDSLTNIDGLSNLTSITGELNLTINEALADIDGLSSLTDIVGTLKIEGSQSLTNINGLSNLTDISGELLIASCPRLSNLEGLLNLTDIEGRILIFICNSLPNLNGLSNLTDLSGSLSVYSNAALTNIDGLSNLTDISGSLSIIANPSLTNIDGLSNLTDISGLLEIIANNRLTDIYAFRNLIGISGDLNIMDNRDLWDCCVLRPILETPGAITGSVIIHDNDTGCSSKQEILESPCGISIEKEVLTDESCDNDTITYGFRIENTLDTVINGLKFKDILASPAIWSSPPYSIENMSVDSIEYTYQSMEFRIDNVSADTIAVFYIDAYLGTWDRSDTLRNSAVLDKVPDIQSGELTSLVSDTAKTFVISSPEITLLDTLFIGADDSTVLLNPIISGSESYEVLWTADGDGRFEDSTSAMTNYWLGEEDFQDSVLSVFLSVVSDCHEIGQQVVIIRVKDECLLNMNNISILPCDDNGTHSDPSDDVFSIEIVVDGVNTSSSWIADDIWGSTGNYGDTVLLGPYNISEGDLDIVIRDSEDSSCTVGLSAAAPASCSEGMNCVDTVVITETTCFIDDTLRRTEVIASTLDGCDTFKITLKDYVGLELEVVPEVSVLEFGDSALLRVVQLDETLIDEVQWSPRASLSCDTCLMTWASPQSNTDYQVEITNVYGCSSSAMTRVEFGDAEIYIPNVFSPNGDGENDQFAVRPGSGVLEVSSIQVYDRWGNLVYERGPYNPRQASTAAQGWDGSFKGQALSSGVYLYVIRIVNAANQNMILTGDVTLLR